jgi:hypothetical protein
LFEGIRKDHKSRVAIAEEEDMTKIPLLLHDEWSRNPRRGVRKNELSRQIKRKMPDANISIIRSEQPTEID